MRNTLQLPPCHHRPLNLRHQNPLPLSLLRNHRHRSHWQQQELLQLQRPQMLRALAPFRRLHCAKWRLPSADCLYLRSSSSSSGSRMPALTPPGLPRCVPPPQPGATAALTSRRSSGITPAAQYTPLYMPRITRLRSSLGWTDLPSIIPPPPPTPHAAVAECVVTRGIHVQDAVNRWRRLWLCTKCS